MNEEDFRKEPNTTPKNYKDFHYCEIPEFSHLHGPAIDNCFEDEDGFLFVSNREYGSQVNFCPWCGYEAKKKVPNKHKN